MNICVDLRTAVAPLRHFWCGTGFTPAGMLMDADMRQALAWVGSLPHGAIRHVRIHFLMDLVRGARLETERPDYDWSSLDGGLEALLQNGLKPFFELMGNPSGWFSDFCDDAQLHAWKRLVRDMALHLIGRYGAEEVRSWFFESWNEPDGRGWWPQFPDNVQAHLNYYDACSEGLREADRALRLGGPGTCVTLSGLFKAFLDHCDNGRNCFTGQHGVRLDFISVHEKGAPPCREDLNPNTRLIIEREAAAVDYIRTHHPRLRDVPFMNNECDPQVVWAHIHSWHARPYYAALVARVINQHQLVLIEGSGVPYGLLNNDNGFLGTWGNRPLVTRFGTDEERAAGRFELVKKPVLNVMALLAMLGDERCATEGALDPYGALGVLATRRGNEQAAVLLYHSRDRIMSSGCERVELAIEGLPFEEPMLVHYRIDEDGNDPFRVWEDMGAPPSPTAAQFAAMRAAQEPHVLDGPRQASAPGGRLSLAFDLPLPSVSLILLSRRPADAPGRVTDLRATAYTGLDGGRQVMLTWQGTPSRETATYEVIHTPATGAPPSRINEGALLCRAFLHAGDAAAAGGRYAVRAIDYWGRAGEWSESAAVQTGQELAFP